MSSDEPGVDGRRLTARGVATRARIVEAAAELMSTRGVAATTLDDVIALSGTSKSQLYGHFIDKDALVLAVVQKQGGRVVELNAQGLARLNSIRGLELWCRAVLAKVTLRDGAHGCELGSLAAELSDVDEDARVLLARMFQSWEQLFVDGFQRMRETGVLRDDADPARLATAVVAAVQGGYLLAQTARSADPMRTALDMALAHVRSFQPDLIGTKPRRRAST